MNEARSIIEKATPPLVRLLHILRPEWDEPGISAALSRAGKADNVSALAIAAIRAANDPAVRTPAVIAMPGRHWTPVDAPPESSYRHPPNLAATLANGCRQHFEPNPCRCCAAEAKADPNPSWAEPRDPEIATVGAARVREILANRPRREPPAEEPITEWATEPEAEVVS